MSQIEVTLHIGMGKTGTSSIQTFLATNASVLRSAGILYPSSHRFKIAEGGAHHSLPFALMVEQPGWGCPPEFSAEQIVGDILREAESSGLHRILLSSEVFYIVPPAAVKAIFHPARVRIVIYIRRQDWHVMSMLNQAIKSMGYFHNTSAVTCPVETFQSTLLLVGDWLQAFSREDVIVRPYEQMQFVSGRLVEDFLSLFDIPWKDEFVLHEERSNGSLSRDGMEYMHQLNAVVCDVTLTREVGELLVGFRAAGGQRASRDEVLLSPSERLCFIERYDALNSRIAKDYLGRDDGRLFYEPLPRADEEWKPYAGLSYERAREMTAYLQTQNRALVGELWDRLRRSSDREGPPVEEAMKVLVPAVESVCGSPG